MATLASQSAVVAKLGSAGAPFQIPGLNLNDIVEGIIEVQFKPVFDDIKAQAENAQEAAEEIKETKDRLVKYFTTDAAKIDIENKIAEIKACVTEIFTQIKAIPEQVIAAIAEMAIPAVISSPPSFPNPIKDILSNKQKVATLKQIAATAAKSLLTVFALATELSFILPANIQQMADQVANLNIVLSTVPV